MTIKSVSRYAVAISAVWYLMVPPQVGGHYQFTAPLLQWSYVNRVFYFDSFEKCLEAQLETENRVPLEYRYSDAPGDIGRAMSMRCVDGDDPALRDDPDRNACPTCDKEHLKW
jgi:hypothetical protein